VIATSFWRSEPAAELLGLAKTVSPSLFLLLVERKEVALQHIDLAAQLAGGGDVLAFQLLGNVLDGADIRSDVLAGETVAARGGADQPPFS
jgi:hypothetical protein